MINETRKGEDKYLKHFSYEYIKSGRNHLLTVIINRTLVHDKPYVIYEVKLINLYPRLTYQMTNTNKYIESENIEPSLL